MSTHDVGRWMMGKAESVLAYVLAGALLFLVLRVVEEMLSSALATWTAQLGLPPWTLVGFLRLLPFLYALLAGIGGSPLWGATAGVSSFLVDVFSGGSLTAAFPRAMILSGYGFLPAKLYSESKARGPTLLAFYGFMLLHFLLYSSDPTISASPLAPHSPVAFWPMFLLAGSVFAVAAAKAPPKGHVSTGSYSESLVTSCPSCGTVHSTGDHACRRCGFVMGRDETRIY